MGSPGEGLHILDQDMCYIGQFSGPDEFPMPWSVGAYMKETSYFSRFYNTLSFTDYCSFFDNNGNGKLSFEASPEYLSMDGVDARIKDACPNAKFVVMLRDPVKRAWSQYWHEVKNTEREQLPFAEAIQRSGPCFCNQYFYSYLPRGHYAEHLERWWSVFPEERFRVYFMEEFFSDTWYFKDLQEWLGLTIAGLDIYPRSTTLSKGYPEMQEYVKLLLQDYYKPHNARLKKILNREELPW
jgi:hypothetical protein